MSNFTDYNNIQQSTENSCGAFAVNACLCQLQLNVKKSIKSLDEGNLVNGYTSTAQEVDLTANSDKKKAAENTYKVTGNLTIDFPQHTATYYAFNSSKQNAPSAMCKTAYEFNGQNGNKINLYYTTGASAIFSSVNQSTNQGFTNNLFDTEKSLINGINNNIQVTETSEYSVPTNSDVHLLLVQHTGGMHWFSVCADTKDTCNIYDPGTGTVYDVSNDKLNQQSSIRLNNVDYTMPGLWILLKK
ncbi:hypothetical protein [Photobacterium galatheae]|uniref:Peptidase C39-like domain-containing protein n=1 Tax=Photobacterium galatheae TaxID=1654360 RepID=A0A066RQI7_9GAMM|nr:hypothetical protein [Photobacterium galatheae]KDM89643.1 hypothetical protein EA58_21435 [Photobacterium galatheae]MCM0149787.1 hypothetical protein [Photobacterium galatheae]